MTAPPKIRALRHVGLRTTALEESVAFYSGPWGLELVERSDDAAYLRAAGPEHHVLQLHAADHNALDHIAFALPTPEEVDAAAAWAAAEGAQIIEPPGPITRPGGGYGFRFTDPENRVLEISAYVNAVAERPQDVPVPRKVAHCVLNTTDIDALTAWYTRVLGLRVSDWSEHQMVFLRAVGDHHVIAFNQAEWAAPNHVAYEVANLDAWLRSIGRLKVAGHETAWGPGRHGPGDNAFAYYVDPAGLVPEMTAEVMQIDDDTWMPRVWPRVPELSDLFRTAGPPSPHIRSHMGGTPDPGWA
ncbi:VOC family protein [Actinocorallia sp. A-T 12471]|uniref:VOC family protein n=1 Tax=Actinocorallia sp. A-T 12471 TaxID=3089813 RepID=UPI0029CFA790|nr:VOC family protein [Actinocorallia sp. A-T 12471]MDX6739568.1 VOC family protein [Actinocorallia sp. A-T 12471]